jgi:hypothetical protein
VTTAARSSRPASRRLMSGGTTISPVCVIHSCTPAADPSPHSSSCANDSSKYSLESRVPEGRLPNLCFDVSMPLAEAASQPSSEKTVS